MKFTNGVVALMQNQLLGYNFRLIEDPARRERFMAALKASVPMKMWDANSKRWWVPDIYSPIIESVALDHGALLPDDLEKVRGFRAKYLNPGEPTLDGDFKILGLQPGVPYRIVEMAASFWLTHLTSISVSVLELQAKQDAWARIQAHFKAENARPLLGPLGEAR